MPGLGAAPAATGPRWWTTTWTSSSPRAVERRADVLGASEVVVLAARWACSAAAACWACSRAAAAASARAAASRALRIAMARRRACSLATRSASSPSTRDLISRCSATAAVVASFFSATSAWASAAAALAWWRRSSWWRLSDVAPFSRSSASSLSPSGGGDVALALARRVGGAEQGAELVVATAGVGADGVAGQGLARRLHPLLGGVHPLLLCGDLVAHVVEGDDGVVVLLRVDLGLFLEPIELAGDASGFGSLVTDRVARGAPGADERKGENGSGERSREQRRASGGFSAWRQTLPNAALRYKRVTTMTSVSMRPRHGEHQVDPAVPTRPRSDAHAVAAVRRRRQRRDDGRWTDGRQHPIGTDGASAPLSPRNRSASLPLDRARRLGARARAARRPKADKSGQDVSYDVTSAPPPSTTEQRHSHSMVPGGLEPGPERPVGRRPTRAGKTSRTT